jgi:ABC-2 type transport system ATP-binding protein
MSAALEATGLGKRYRRSWALRDCSVAIPEGRVVALVGPNGAGKTTLLHLAVGLLAPSAGEVRVLGAEPANRPEVLARVGFLAQDKPLYPGFTVAEMLRFGARLNPGWDQAVADRWLERFELPPGRRVGQLSGGQRTSWRWRWRWPSGPGCCCWTSPWPTWTRWSATTSPSP